MSKGWLQIGPWAAIALFAAGCTSTSTTSAPTSTAFHWPWQAKPASAMPVVTTGAGSASDPTSLANKPPKPGPDLFVATARMYEKTGKPDLAIEQFDKALKADPKYLPALLGLAQLHDCQREFTEADKLYDRAVKQYPQEAAIYNDLALSQQHRGQLDQARQAMERAIALQPDKKLYRNNMASILVDMNQPEAAFKQLMAAHGPAAGHYNLAILLHRKGDDVAARYQFAQAAEVDPSLVAAREWAHRLGPNDPSSQFAARRPTEQSQMAAAPTAGPVMPADHELPMLHRPVFADTPGQDQGAAGQMPAAPGFEPVGAPNLGVRYPQHTDAIGDDDAPPTPDRLGDVQFEVAGLRRLPPLQ